MLHPEGEKIASCPRTPLYQPGCKVIETHQGFNPHLLSRASPSVLRLTRSRSPFSTDISGWKLACCLSRDVSLERSKSWKGCLFLRRQRKRWVTINLSTISMFNLVHQWCSTRYCVSCCLHVARQILTTTEVHKFISISTSTVNVSWFLLSLVGDSKKVLLSNLIPIYLLSQLFETSHFAHYLFALRVACSRPA